MLSEISQAQKDTHAHTHTQRYLTWDIDIITYMHIMYVCMKEDKTMK